MPATAERQQQQRQEGACAQEAMPTGAAGRRAPLVGGVDHVHERIGVLVVVLPVRPNMLLPADVPHVELEP